MTEPKSIEIADYNYLLPDNRIAFFPLEKRDQSRLLIYKNDFITDEVFYNLPQHLPAETLLVLNDTRVIEARILFEKETGGTIEIFCLEPLGGQMETAMQARYSSKWICLIGGASKWKAGQVLKKPITLSGIETTLEARYLSKLSDGFEIEFSWNLQNSFAEVLQVAGLMPLPPYIKRKAEAFDEERYQTVFNTTKGSVAAPTASLHFTKEVLGRIIEKNINISYITLHVGAGTFKPVQSEKIGDHPMHGEAFSVKKSFIRQLMNPVNIVAVGTTSLRTLESLYWIGVKIKTGKSELYLHQWEAYELAEKGFNISVSESMEALVQYMEKGNLDVIHCKTSLLIAPGYIFKVPKGLITNFHQPRSTLLLLIAAFIGDDWKKVYEHALKSDYRFLSYGDSSLLWRNIKN